MITWTHRKGDRYLVTGKEYRTGRKFRLVYENPHMALAINLWQGRVWHLRQDGSRKLLRTVVN